MTQECSSLLARSAHALRLASLLLVATLAPSVAPQALGQAASDFMAYPNSLTDLKSFRNPKNPRQIPFNRMPGLSADYQLGAGDELEITIVGWSDDALGAKISGTGEVALPMLGPIRIAGMTAEQAETVIATELRERQLIKNAEVLIFISAYEAKTIYAMGEVDRPGEYGMSFQTTLMDLIFMAGGIDFTAARYGYLHRRGPTQETDWKPTYVYREFSAIERQPALARPGSEVIVVDLKPVTEGGVLEHNYVLRNGDVFYVPRRMTELVYVIGDVVSPGAFEIPEGRTLTAARAISWAGGPAKTAKLSKGMLVRYGEGGHREELPIDFAAVLRGEQPDIEIRNNDIVFVPGSNAKSVAYGVLNIIPAILATAVVF